MQGILAFAVLTEHNIFNGERVFRPFHNFTHTGVYIHWLIMKLEKVIKISHCFRPKFH